MRIAVTGGGGQLGQCLKDAFGGSPGLEVVFFEHASWDICNGAESKEILKQGWDVLINTAAYTAVDRAEEEEELCRTVNHLAPGNLAKLCHQENIHFLHISSDYVYHNDLRRPLKTSDPTTPSGVYAQSKLDGEKSVKSLAKDFTIIRTSWVYSEYGHNFLKTMIKLSESHKTLKVVSDQWGVPTYARDLADFIFFLTSLNPLPVGTVNFSNSGWTNWYEFAQRIFAEKDIEIDVHPISTKDYPTAAKRPPFSIMDLAPIHDLGYTIPHFHDALSRCLKEL